MSKLDHNINKAIPHPKCPTLAWMIAKRVTDPDIELDCTIMVTGKKGTGKSTFCIALGYNVAKCIAIIKNRSKINSTPINEREALIDELSQQYFNIDHIKTVDKDGTFDMFSGEVIMTENSVLLCDDVSIAANARNSMSQQNKSITQVMTVSRPYRNVVILNTVYSTLVDKNARNFSDIVIELLYIDKKKKRSVSKAYLYTVNQSSGKEYRKFFTWKGQRIKYWFSYLPPKFINMKYKEMRLQKTRELIESFREQRDEQKEKGHKMEKKFNEAFDKYGDELRGMIERGDKINIREFVRKDPILTRDRVEKIIAYINGGK